MHVASPPSLPPTPPPTPNPTPGCKLSKWGHWKPCTKTCGGGLKERRRVVISPLKPSCSKKTSELRACNVHPCPVMTPTPSPPSAAAKASPSEKKFQILAHKHAPISGTSSSRICAGTTRQAVSWVTQGPHGVALTVNTSKCRFSSPPHYIAAVKSRYAATLVRSRALVCPSAPFAAPRVEASYPLTTAYRN